jgi:hypothetical protein
MWNNGTWQDVSLFHMIDAEYSITMHNSFSNTRNSCLSSESAVQYITIYIIVDNVLTTYVYPLINSVLNRYGCLLGLWKLDLVYYGGLIYIHVSLIDQLLSFVNSRNGKSKFMLVTTESFGHLS